jgi:hypothetical protein
MVLFNGRRFWTSYFEGSGIACRTCPLADKVSRRKKQMQEMNIKWSHGFESGPDYILSGNNLNAKCYF